LWHFEQHSIGTAVAYRYGVGVGTDVFFDIAGISTPAHEVLVSAGNHDYDYSQGKESHDPSNALPFRPRWAKFAGDSNGECGVALQARFLMPDNG
jgi:hypothetical protein